jgi:hypothetical protein
MLSVGLELDVHAEGDSDTPPVTLAQPLEAIYRWSGPNPFAPLPTPAAPAPHPDDSLILEDHQENPGA